MLSFYDRLLIHTCSQLHEQGARDPTFLEIGCAYSHKPPPPPDFPWTTTDLREQGLIDTVHDRIDAIQNAFSDDAILMMPIAAEYYEHGHRGLDPMTPPSIEQIEICLPRAYHKSVGFRFTSLDDPYFAVYLDKRGIRTSSGVRGVIDRLRKAIENGTLSYSRAAETHNKLTHNMGDLRLPAERVGETMEGPALIE